MAKFRLGDTVCDIENYDGWNQLKAFVVMLSIDENKMHIAYTNRLNFLETYKKHYKISRVVLFEKYTKMRIVKSINDKNFYKK